MKRKIRILRVWYRGRIDLAKRLKQVNHMAWLKRNLKLFDIDDSISKGITRRFGNPVDIWREVLNKI